MEYVIYDLANGILQWQGEAESEEDAWVQFRTDLGYGQDEPNICTRDAYLVETKADFDNAALNP